MGNARGKKKVLCSPKSIDEFRIILVHEQSPLIWTFLNWKSKYVGNSGEISRLYLPEVENCISSKHKLTY